MASMPGKRQFVQLRLLQAVRKFDPSRGSIGGYMRAAQQNALRSWDRLQRTEKRRQRRTRYLDDLIEEPYVESEARMTEIKDELDSVMKQLDKRQQNMLTMLFVLGYSLPEVAGTMSMTTKALSELKSRTISQLRARK